jgi:hypothetical protein
MNVQLAVKALEPRLVPSVTYYVATGGHDSDTGLSADHAWATPGRASNVLQPGDTLLFEGGDTFTGSLTEDGGTDGALVTIGSYGTGKATLTTTGTAVTINGGDVTIQDLTLRGAAGDIGNGVSIQSWATASAHDTVTNVSAYDFGVDLTSTEDQTFIGWGVVVINVPGLTRDVHVTSCEVAGCLTGGVALNGANGFAVTNCNVHDCPGYAPLRFADSGHGIVAYSCVNGTTSYDTIANNGQNADPIGSGIMYIFTKASTISHCTVSGLTGVSLDGAAFTFDNSSYCTAEYNTSHDNYGPGIICGDYEADVDLVVGNVIRYNTSTDDGLKWGSEGVLEVTDKGGYGTQVYGNSITVGHSRFGAVVALMVQGYGLTPSDSIHDNTFTATDPADVLVVGSGKEYGVLQRNTYADPYGFQAIWQDTTYTDFASWELAVGESGGVFNP